MFLQKPDSRNRIKNIVKGIILFSLNSIVLFSIGCKSDIDKINSYALTPNLPTATYTNASFEYSDTAKLQARLNTPKVHYYINSEEPYYEFPEGIKVVFFDNDEKMESEITSKYAIYKEEEAIFEVRDSVVVKDLRENQTIETEQLFWNQNKKLIYSEVFTKISNPDGTYYGERGFEAAQDLSYYKLIGTKGKVKVKDEEK